MSFFDILFGSEGEFREPPPPDVQNVSKLDPSLQRLLDETLTPFLGSEDLSGVLGPEFEGQLAPGAGEIERLSLSALEQQAMNLANPEGDIAQTISGAQTAFQDLLSTGPQDIDDFFTKTVQDPLLQNFERDILPSIGRNFGGTSFFGSERQEADSRAREDLLTTLTRTRASTAFGARENDLNRILGALGITGQVASAGSQTASGILGGGIQGRQLQGEKLRAEYADFVRRTGERDKRIEQILASLGLGTNENIVTPQIFEQGQEGLIGEVIAATGRVGQGVANQFIGGGSGGGTPVPTTQRRLS